MKYLVSAICAFLLLLSCKKNTSEPSGRLKNYDNNTIPIEYYKYIDSMRNGFGNIYIISGDTLYIVSDS